MRFDLQPAFILHRRPFRNTSLLIEAYTQEQGRIGLIARGASRPKARLRGILQAFTPLWLSWVEGSELGTFKAAEERGAAYAIAPERLLSGLYLNELLLRLMARHDPYPQVFQAYERALQGLMQISNEELVLRRFEKILLDELGYGLQLSTDIRTGESIQAEKNYCYHTQQGPQAISETSVPGTITGRALLALRDNRLDELTGPGELKQIKFMMRAAIAAHLDKPLRSREIMAKLYRQQQAHEYP